MAGSQVITPDAEEIDWPAELSTAVRLLAPLRERAGVRGATHVFIANTAPASPMRWD